MGEGIRAFSTHMQTAMKYLECQARGMSERRIAKKFGVTPQAVSAAIRRLLGPAPRQQLGRSMSPDAMDRLDPAKVIAQA